MMPKKKEGETPGSGKAQCNSVGGYQDREVGRGGLGNRGKEEGLWDFLGVGSQERGNYLKCELCLGYSELLG